MTEDLTRKFVALLRSGPGLSPDTAPVARLLLLDGLAVAAMGSREPGPRILAELARERACPPAATVIAQGFATAPEHAARINGTAMHVLDYEPMWNPPNHAVSTILPALLALAETQEATGPPQGERVLGALLVGIEAQGRLRLASRQIEPRTLTLHPPGVVGPISAAVACATLLGLDEEMQVAAIGIAASRASGLMANVGSMTKALHCGDAAMHGLDSALLAARGFTSDRDALGGPRGYGAAYFGDRFDSDALLMPTAVPRAISPGPAWKLFPSQYGTHFAITAALEARDRLASAEAPIDVAITSPVMPYIDRPRPRSGLDGKSSLQYCVAAAILDGRVDLATFSDRRRFAPEMEAMLGRVRLMQDPSIPAGFDRMHVDVCATLAGGMKVTSRCTAPLGSWSRPVEPARVEAKAQDLLVDVLGEDRWNVVRKAIARPMGELRISDLMAALSVEANVQPAARDAHAGGVRV